MSWKSGILHFMLAMYSTLVIILGVLKSIRERYNDVIHGVLEPIRKQLAKDQYRFETMSQLHPKIERVARMINNILRKPDRKIIILVRRYFECCFSALETSLHCMKNMVLQKYPKEVAEEGFILDLISQANVIVAELSGALQFCPWNRFSSVFEFEFREDSQWFSLCHEGNPNVQGFFALNCSLPKDFYHQGMYNRLSLSPS